MSKEESSEKAVRITMQEGLPVPDQDPVEIQKGKHKVRWYADFDFKIEVEGYDDMKHIKNGGRDFWCTTGVFADVRKYKYSITANGVTNDPEVDVKP